MEKEVSLDELLRNLAVAYTKAVNGYWDITRSCAFYDVPGFEELREGLDDLREVTEALISNSLDSDTSPLADDAEFLPFADPN